ncbi:hypothetical protein M4951_08330 [Blastopirellula sp. J2-11]|uniref:hypothetical protein n=1 Tax=Blastopirellula sp. J2-11 TaxID=2943192 RepID=UPI0021CA38B0|nr:hypothetical protein [Blastopirellula sp. J2-11]UUO08308.1 hypothetical protein M4951_08330 [Blastopirellula sp. J2-11]
MSSANFYALLRDGHGIIAQKIPVSNSVQKELSEVFKRQSDAFHTFSHKVDMEDGKTERVESESEVIDFFPIYTISDNSQIFEIDYQLDGPIAALTKSLDGVPNLAINDNTIPSIRAILAIWVSRSSTKICFQSFDRRRILSPKKMTFLEAAGTFSRLDKPGFTLGEKADAVFEDGKLHFRSFPVVARFLNLIELFDEASDEKIEEVLRHQLLYVGDADSVKSKADLLMRKQFAAVSSLGILDKAKPRKIRDSAVEFGINVKLKQRDGKMTVEFPETKKEQKEFLRFLTEGFYLGPITGTKYQSNSHRPWKGKK